MRTVTIALLISLVLPVLGCQPKEPPVTDEVVWRADAGGLLVEANVPHRRYVRGQTVALTVSARNTTDEAIVIKADTGALVCARLWRRTAVGWEEVKRYPQAAVVLASPWRLAAGEAHTFTLNLPVEPDWPTNEPLKLTAELNGRPDVAPGGLIRVFATQADYDKAMGE